MNTNGHDAIGMMQVDDQQIFVPSELIWAKILNSGSYDQIRLTTWAMGVAIGVLEIAHEHPKEFKIGLCKHSSFARSWTVVVLFWTGAWWQRVHFEQIRCGHCLQRWLIANPMVSELYLGSPKKWDALDRAALLQTVACKVCGNELPRFAAWARPLPKKDDD